MDSANAFAELARDYCDLVDRAGALGRDAFLEAIEPRIARLYASAAELPRVDPESDEEVEFAVDAALTRKQLEALFLSRDYFRVLFDPWSDDEPVHASLPDCLADIYLDLRKGLTAFESGYPAEGVWEWRFGWEIHWGRHAWEALAAIRSLQTA